MSKSNPKTKRKNMYLTVRKYLITTILSSFVLTATATDLREFYETQKVELLESFKAPAIDSTVSLTLTTKVSRTGILKALTKDTATVKTTIGLITYRQEMLDTATRQKFFAEDYATAVAIVRTRNLKAQESTGSTEEESGPVVHSVRLSASGKIEKDTNLEKILTEVKENQNGSGNTKDPKETRVTTKTQTYTVDIALANTSPNEGTFQVEWYFICRNVTEDADLFIGEKGGQEFTLAGRTRAKHSITSKTLSTIESKESGGSGNSDKEKGGKTGSELNGYIVVVKHDGEILGKTATSSAFLKEEWIAKLDGSITEPEVAKVGGKKKGKKDKKDKKDKKNKKDK